MWRNLSWRKLLSRLVMRLLYHFRLTSWFQQQFFKLVFTRSNWFKPVQTGCGAELAFPFSVKYVVVIAVVVLSLLQWLLLFTPRSLLWFTTQLDPFGLAEVWPFWDRYCKTFFDVCNHGSCRKRLDIDNYNQCDQMPWLYVQYYHVQLWKFAQQHKFY